MLNNLELLQYKILQLSIQLLEILLYLIYN